MTGSVDAREYLASQPPESHVPDALEKIRARVAAGGRKIAVLDDAPTGTQTHGLVLAGSHVALTTRQLAEVLNLDGVLGVELSVAGQMLPGIISVWILPEESAFPGLPYIIFAGDVGGPDSLARVKEILRGE